MYVPRLCVRLVSDSSLVDVLVMRPVLLKSDQMRSKAPMFIEVTFEQFDVMRKCS